MIYSLLSVVLLCLLINSLRPESFFTQLPTFQTSSYVVNRNFDEHYIQMLNQYLKIVPTPLGMQIDPYRIYRTVADVDYQQELLNSLLTTPAPIVAAGAVGHAPEATTEIKVVSLKTISKNFWRHL
ncbi:hypothetical protein H6G93_36365 [Nostoc sp. FACHB-973]|nr:hypothetical protein [Nostoc sp. FACHB-973]